MRRSAPLASARTAIVRPSLPPRSQSVPSTTQRFAPQPQPIWLSRTVETTRPLDGSIRSRLAAAPPELPPNAQNDTPATAAATTTAAAATSGHLRRRSLAPTTSARRCAATSGSSGDGRRSSIETQAVEEPLALDAFELMGAGFLESRAGADHEVARGSRRENLCRTGDRHHAGADVHGDACQLPVDLLALAGVEPGTYVQPDFLNRGRERRGGPQRLGGLGERGVEAVARRVLLAAATALQLAADDLAEPRQHHAPMRVAELRRKRGRADDVDEQNSRDAPTGPRSRHAAIIRAGGSAGYLSDRGAREP